MRNSLALVVSSLLGAVAQFNPESNSGSPGISSGTTAFNGSRLCDRTFADANATGIFTYDPNLSVPQSLQPEYNITTGNAISWAVTAYESPDTSANDSIVELTLWFSPEGKNFSDNFALGYDSCYLYLFGLTLNSLERGQEDNGTCLSTLDEACVNDLQSQTDQYALELVSNPTPGPNSNLTENSLPTVCGDLATRLTDNFPKSCNPFFNSTRQVYGGVPGLGGPLTGNSSYVERAHCQTNGSYSMMWSQFAPATEDDYLVANYWVAPLITAWFPIANVDRPTTLGGAKSFTSCLRAKNLNAGSQDVPAAPLPTPVDTSNSSSTVSSTSTASSTSIASSTATTSSSPTASGAPSSSSNLSNGAIAGIVIAGVLGLAIIAALLIFFLFKKRVQEALEKKRGRRSSPEFDKGSGYVEMDHGIDRKAYAVESASNPISEIGSSGMRTVGELGDNKEWAVEMPANREVRAINRHPVEVQ